CCVGACRNMIFLKKPSSGMWICDSSVRSHTRDLGWVSSAQWPGSAVSNMSVRRFPFHGCCTNSTRSLNYLDIKVGTEPCDHPSLSQEPITLPLKISERSRMIARSAMLSPVQPLVPSEPSNTPHIGPLVEFKARVATGYCAPQNAAFLRGLGNFVSV